LECTLTGFVARQARKLHELRSASLALKPQAVWTLADLLRRPSPPLTAEELQLLEKEQHLMVFPPPPRPPASLWCSFV
jgi:hypothetical protein